ncbi:MAG: DUF554 domain-containing protein [Clostridia bacterium]|nr:DUF554 domain-containing protein [Clostridia bacterium]
MGVIVNFASIIVGTLLGLVFKKGIPDKISDTITKGVGLCVLLIGLSGVLLGENMLITVISIVIGAAIGELIDIDRLLNCLGKGIEKKLSKGKESNVAQGFVSATLLFCVGAMTVVGSLNCGLGIENDTLYTKALLDGISAIIFASTFGYGVIFSAVPVLVLQGGIALSAHYVAPLLTETIINEMTCVGSLLIIALSFNLLGICKLKVANYLPAIFIPILLCQFM